MMAIASAADRSWSRVPSWLPAVVLIVVTSLIAPLIGALCRPLFLTGCVLVGYFAWARSPGEHLQAAIVLFSLAPFVRRVVDLTAGFDAAGTMIAGPLLAILVPISELRVLLLPARATDRFMALFIVMGACLAYCTLLTIANGEWSQAISNMLKWGAPLVYGAALYLRKPDRVEVVRDATAAFAVVLPITGLYGLYQYIDPPLWDRYWLAHASITSAGLPEPYLVRVFSTMHAPAAFASFTAIGLMLVVFLRRGWPAYLSILPAVLALLLSLYRTAWLSLAVSVSICLLFPSTRGKSISAILVVALAVIAALALSPFGEVIGDRLSTLANLSDDGSGNERLAQFATLYNRPDSTLFGSGFASVDVGVAGAEPVDGMFVACWGSMGIVVGLLYLAALFAVIFGAIKHSLNDIRPEVIVLGALACGSLVQVPLANITSGELGFLFWTFATLAWAGPPEGARGWN